MRIEKLSFKNINSLEGHWTIDFTDDGLNGDGLFLITGATGSGKTTILDAICIALFGRTPRLNALTVGENGAITKGQKDCFAEVIFSVDGKCYRSKWSQRYKNPRKGHPATLDKPVRELSFYPSEELFAGNAKELAAKVADIIGMSYEQFSKSVMLAQGDFSRFLKASDNDRAAILEQITGTNIYSDISKKVYERSKAESEKLQIMDAELGSMQILGNEERLQVQMELKDGLDREKILEEELRQEQDLMQDATALKKAQLDAAVLKSDDDDLKKAELEFAPRRQELLLQQKLSPLFAQYKVLTHSRENLAEVKKKLESLQSSQLPKAQNAIAQDKEQELQKAKSLEEAVKKAQSAAPVIEEARAHESTLSGLDESLQQQLALVKKSKAALASLKKKAQKSADLLKEKQTQQDKIQKSIVAIPDAEGLNSHLSAIEHMFSELSQKKQQLSERNAAFEKAQRSLKSAQSQAGKAQKLHKKSEDARQDLEKDLENARLKLDGVRGSLSEDALNRIMSAENDLISECSHCLNDAAALDSAFSEYDTSAKELEKNTKKLQKLAQEVSADEEHLKDLEGSAQSARIALESLYDLQKAFYLSRKLKPDEPCPCCGSKVHPHLPSDPVFEKTEAEYKARAESTEQAFADAQRLLNKKKEKLSKAQGILDGAEANAAGAHSRLQDALLRLKNALCQVQDKLSLLENSDSGFSFDVSLLQEDLDARKAVAVSELLKDLASYTKDRNTAHLKAHSEIQEHKALLDELTERKQQLDGKLADEKLELSKLQLEAENAQVQLTGCEDEFEHAQHDYQSLKEQLSSDLKLYDFATAEALEESPDKVLAKLDDLCSSFKDLSLEESSVKDEISRLDTEVSKLDEDLKQKQEELQSLDETYQGIKQRQQSEQEQLHALIGDTSAGDFEKELKALVDNARSDHEKALKALNLSQNNLTAINSAIEEHSASFEKQQGELESRELDFKQELTKLDLKDEDEFRLHLMEESEYALLNEKARLLDDKRSSLNTLLAGNAKRILDLEAKVPADLNYDDLALSISRKKNDHKELLKHNGSLSQSLSDDDKRRELKNEKLAQRDLQDKCCSRWRALNEMVGSASGDKFKMFAQELTLKALIAEANVELKIFNDRYILTQSSDPKEPLHFNVIDTWHDGHSRGVENLSGGESFIISLALALAISHMAHGRHSIETLFLDEGFGTLDPKSLDTALNALVQLNSRHSGLIGIISHIEQLRDSISSKIVVERRPDGFSRLSGPGCHGQSS